MSVAQTSGTSGINTTSASSGYTGASGAENFLAGVAPTGSFDPATSAYFTFTIMPTTGHGVNTTSLTLGSRSTGTGPTLLSLYSSADNFTSAVSSVTATANSTWALIDFGSFNITTATDTGLTFRIYGSNGSGNTGPGNWRIDDVTLTVSSVPEPATFALLGGVSVLGLATLRRRRSRRTPSTVKPLTAR